MASTSNIMYSCLVHRWIGAESTVLLLLIAFGISTYMYNAYERSLHHNHAIVVESDLLTCAGGKNEIL